MLYNPNTARSAISEMIPSAAAVSTTITGRYLSQNRMSARDRARLAADIIAGRVMIDASSLTIKQIAKLCRTNNTYLDEIRFPDRVKRTRRIRLAQAFDKIDFDSRVELCRVIGAEQVWNALAAAVD